MGHGPKRKVLVLTGRLCAAKIKELVKDLDVDVCALPIDVACLMTSSLIASELQHRDLSGYDFVLVPGSVRESLEDLERALGIPFYLGPVHFQDIPLVLEGLPREKLSKQRPADAVMRRALARRTTDLFRKAKMVPTEVPAFTVILGSGESRVAAGKSFPPSLIAEVVDAPRKDPCSILQEAKRFVASGADMVDLGMVPGEDHTDFIRSTLPLIRRDVRVPVSVDTMREAEILAAADAGADLILSICGETLDLVPSIECPVVIVPLPRPNGPRPRSSSEKLKLLAEYSAALEGHPTIIDPLLEPIGLGFSESIRAYMDLDKVLPDRPSLMGIGNVVELADVDSIGLNAALAAIAVETRTSLLLATENSPKTQGTIRELSKACQMMFFSITNRLPPKNLGIDLLFYKEKFRRSYPVDLPSVKVCARPPDRESPALQDENRFHIIVRDCRIHTICHCKEGTIDVIGLSADEIANELELRGLMPSPRHAFYLGRELAKAELALSMGRSYIQDLPLVEGSEVETHDEHGRDDRDGR